MKYINIYNSIIENAKSQQRNKGDAYYESHHIIPKSLGGSNNKNNKVLLSGKEHFICHHLLTKIYPKSNSMYYAFWCMCNYSSQNQQRVRPTSTTYENIKKQFAKISSKRWLTNNPNTWIDNTGENNPMYNVHRFGEENPFYGKKHSQTTKNKIANSKKGSELSPEHKLKLKESWKDRPIIKCPYCPMESIHIGNMNRYHFEKCKLNPHKS